MSISPNVPSPQESYHYETTGTPRWIVVLFGVVIAALAALGFAGYNTESRMSQDLAAQQKQNKILTAQLDEANTRIADLKSKMEITTQRVGLTQSEIAQAKSRAETIRKEQQTSDQKLTAQLKESEEKLGAVATEVGGAKKDIEATKTDLEATKGKLERSLGDMNVMSGLIARNHDDLDELRQKDKTSGEPVQFYVKGSSRMAPYEIVVFDVGKNQITGYLATPKDGGAAAAPAPAATPTKP